MSPDKIYANALNAIDALMDAAPGTVEARRLIELSKWVEEYERPVMADDVSMIDRALDGDQLCYVLWRMSGERLPVRQTAAILADQLKRAYRRGRKTEARKRLRSAASGRE